MFWLINTSSGTVTNAHERKKQKYESQPYWLKLNSDLKLTFQF